MTCNSNLAREAGRLYEWKEKFWGRRYQAIVVSNEEEAQIDRLNYILSNSVKEGLVDRPQDWPGAHSVDALLTGEPLEGLWFDRTKEYAARGWRDDFDRLKYATVEILTLDPLPCWSGLSDDQYRERIASLVTRIEAEAQARRESQGREPLGREAILAQEPHSKPVRWKKSPAPRFHAFRKSVRRELYDAYAWFVAAFRDASEKLRSGRQSFRPEAFPPLFPSSRSPSDSTAYYQKCAKRPAPRAEAHPFGGDLLAVWAGAGLQSGSQASKGRSFPVFFQSHLQH